MTTTMLGCNLRLSDVHAMAETVGREFKKLTDSFGMQCAMGLVPPVLEALEQLEVYVESYQQLQTRLSELQMDNDTVAYEREQKAKLADENESLTTLIRQLQWENKRLLVDMDDLHYKNEELATEMFTLQNSSHTGGLLYAVKEDAISDSPSVASSSSSPPPTPPTPHPPHSPHRVTHMAQNHSSPPDSHSPCFSPSPSPVPSSLLSPPASSSHDHSLPLPSSPDPTPHTPPLPSSHTHTPHTLPLPSSHTHTPHTPPLPSPHNHTLPSPPSSYNNTPHTPPIPPSHRHRPHSTRYSYTPPATRVPPKLLKSAARSSSLSDMVKIRVQALSLATPEHEEQDMYERSRVTRRLSVVEGELKIATSRLHDLQRSLEKIESENTQLKRRLEESKAESALKQLELSQRELKRVGVGEVGAKETPRYYKEEMIRVLTERNHFKERVVAMQEELEGVREALRRAKISKVVEVERARAATNVRSILTESICLDSYMYVDCSIHANKGKHILPTKGKWNSSPFRK